MFVSLKQRKVKTSFGKFVNPYTNRSNGGIPIFSQERIQERAKKVVMYVKFSTQSFAASTSGLLRSVWSRANSMRCLSQSSCSLKIAHVNRVRFVADIIIYLVPVVYRVGGTIHCINHSPLHKSPSFA